MRTIARHASCCLEFDSCEQNSFISNCKVPPQYQCSGHKGDIFTKRTKGSTISMGKKLDGSYHANVKHLETKSEFHPWFETLKHWKQPTCCFSSRFVLNRGYCATNRPCQKAWSANWKMLAYIIIHPVKRQYGCCFFFSPKDQGENYKHNINWKPLPFRSTTKFQGIFKKLNLKPPTKPGCESHRLPNHPLFLFDVFVVAKPKNLLRSLRWGWVHIGNSEIPHITWV